MNKSYVEVLPLPRCHQSNPKLIANKGWSKRKECKVSFVLDHIYFCVQDVDFDPEPSILCFFPDLGLFTSDVKLLTDGSVMAFVTDLEKVILYLSVNI